MKIALEGFVGFPTVEVTPDVDDDGNSLIVINVSDYTVDEIDNDLDNDTVTITVTD